MSARVAYIAGITQVTLVFIKDTLLVYNQWLCFMHFKFLVNFAAHKHGVGDFLHFLAKGLELFFFIISVFLMIRPLD